jgi:hypothetical protein
MGSKKGVTLSPAIEAQIAEVDAMTLEAVRKLLFDCMTVLSDSKINPQEGEALTRATENRLMAIRKEHAAIAHRAGEIAKRQAQRMRWTMGDPQICDAYEASLAPA